MLIEVTNVIVNKNEVVVEGLNIEQAVCSEDFFEDLLDEKVRFIFPKNNNESFGAIKYLIKVTQSQKKAMQAKSLGARFEALEGCIINLSESFLENSYTA